VLDVDELGPALDTFRRSREYKNYEHVREHVLQMKVRGLPDEPSRPSAYWAEELAGFDYMLDASPLIVRKLRQHTFHITGLRVYDYRSHRDDARRKFELKLRALIELAGGRELLVPESPELGGFGYDVDGELFNVDTLKFFEALIGMELAAVLGAFRRATERSFVWEIGAGWGGFAYQFKTLFPNVTYVISDFPEVILFSGVYLTTLFPDAAVSFVEHEEEFPADDEFRELDFVFVPHTLTESIRPARLDFALNMVSFQEMTTAQVEGYVRHAYELGVPYLYSLNRDRSPYNPELTNVRDVIERWYWPHEIDVLPVSYTKLVDDPALLRPRKRPRLDRAHLDYRHICGWKRP
jgi:hypothetical protein